ncbi:Stress-associated endoplasmic reticulum protein 2 [Myotis brandtii]|uniref:Stress-associated endoplasmic reticulum protein n=1 Tax=Myotis brandtii TaxID=109478 RepID=S7MR78_MYOBR|nr:Stress-associated endoplasmic reticulum protein 2 [Myotis brandtii]
MGAKVAGVGLPAKRGPGMWREGPGGDVEDGPRPTPVPTAASQPTVPFKRPQEEKYPVGPWLLALFVFVVCGSDKMHCPEIPAVQPSWVCSQMDNAYIKSWLLLD